MSLGTRVLGTIPLATLPVAAGPSGSVWNSNGVATATWQSASIWNASGAATVSWSSPVSGNYFTVNGQASASWQSASQWNAAGIGNASWVSPTTYLVLLKAPFFQNDIVPGPVTVQLRKWNATGTSWVNDGTAQSVTQLDDPNIPNSYVIDASYNPNADGSYQAVPIWNLAAVSGWQNGHVYSLGALVQPVAVPNGHYFKVTTAGTSGGSEPTWNLGTTTTDNTVTWTDQGQCLYDGVPLYLPATSAGILALFQATNDWQTLLANVNGVYSTIGMPTSFPGVGQLILNNKANTTTYANLGITFNSIGLPTARSSS